MIIRISISLVGTVFVAGSLICGQAAAQGTPAPRMKFAETAAPSGLTTGEWSGLRAAYDAAIQRVAEHTDGFLSRQPAQAWRTVHDSSGFTTTPKEGDWEWGLELKSWGFENALVNVEQAESLCAERDTVRLEWSPELTEWWVNGTGGLEHGFTVHRRPGGAKAGRPLRLTLDIRGELVPRALDDLRSVLFEDGDRAPVLEYAGLVAFDSRGRDLPAWIEVADDQLILCVNEREAEYPLIIDPFVQSSYFKASTPGPSDFFGISVAIDGNVAVIGAFAEDSAGTGVNSASEGNNDAPGSGAAYIFRRSGAGWVQEAYVKASNTDSGDRFGRAVDVSGDTVVVSAHAEASGNGLQSDNSTVRAGAVYVYRYSSGTWIQEAYLKDLFPGTDDWFGYSLAICRDTIAIGAPNENSGGRGVNSGSHGAGGAPYSGAAYTYKRDGTAWTLEAHFKSSNSQIADSFGWSVGLSEDTLVVGAVREDSAGMGVNSGMHWSNSAPESGAAYVFRRADSSWIQEAYLKASNTESYDRFGQVVDVSGDTIVVGAPDERSAGTGVNGGMQLDNSAVGAGAVYVFQRSEHGWRQEAYLKASNTDAGDSFAQALDIERDTIIVAAPNEASGGTGVNGGAESDNSVIQAGAAYVFTRGPYTWEQRAYVKASNSGLGDAFGVSVATSGDALLIGAPAEDSSVAGTSGAGQGDNSMINAGAAYGFVRRTIGTPYCGPAVPNSTGSAAVITAVGSRDVSRNDMTLRCESMPPGMLGYFLMSRTSGFVMNPGGSQGNLCLGGAIGSFSERSFARKADCTGSVSLPIDLGVIPTLAGFSSVQAGDSWNFQCWFRDLRTGVPTSNFSNGLMVTYF